jgi:catechol 2,3-dioxygenase-like lactoylglutathione lyase family enzyme
MSSTRASRDTANGSPTYLEGGDPALADYYPVWLDNPADDVTVEGSMMDGVAVGPEALRTIVGTIRTLYGDSQKFHFAGPCGDNRWLEDYVAEVDGQPLGCVALITRNAAGQTQHLVASYRPRSSLLSFARLLGEKFAGTPFEKHFVAGAGSDPSSGSREVGTIDMKLEVVTLPVSDVDRAKRFYESLGWRLDADIVVGDNFRAVQLTPTHSACSIAFGKGLTTAEPGSVQRLELVVSDIDAARDDLLSRGVEVSELFHLAGGRVPGPDPERRSYQTYASFSDPDGNAWLLQEIRTRLPGREWDD